MNLQTPNRQHVEISDSLRYFTMRQEYCHKLSRTYLVVIIAMSAQSLCAQLPPVFNTVFPAGGQIGKSVDVTISGNNLQTVSSLQCSISGVRSERLEENRFRLTIPPNAMPGLYDLWAVGDNGISSPRSFAVGRHTEYREVEPNESRPEPMLVPLDSVINGQIDKAGDMDTFRFEATKGRRVIVECWADRIDSRLRAVLELFDSKGRRLLVNRGYYGPDPLIDFLVPENGSYWVKVYDLISSGGPEHYYRLEIDTGPRVVFAVPMVVQRGRASRVTLYGWNLRQRAGSLELRSQQGIDFDSVEVEIPASLAEASWPLPVRLQPSQAVLAGTAFPYYFPGSHGPLVIGITDTSVCVDQNDNHSPGSAQSISVPCEISGQLTDGDERDWFALDARRGEAYFVEAFGQRISSPVDLQISIYEGRSIQSKANGEIVDQPAVLAQFGDELRNLGGAFSTSHLDPSGRWVSPSDGRFLIAVQNLSGGLRRDLRRVYRLSIRREEPEFQIVAIPQRGSPVGLNLQRGGRGVLELLALRRRGFDGPIRVSAQQLPSGVECPDVWFGPGADRTTLVVSAGDNADLGFGELLLEAQGEVGGQSIRCEVRGGSVVRSGRPIAGGRIVSKIPMAISGAATLRITADGHETVRHPLYGNLHARHSPGGALDIAVQIDRSGTAHQAPVKLIGTGLHDLIPNQTAVVPAGQTKGYLSFQLPSALPIGRYSFVVRAETTVPTSNEKTETIVVHSNPVTIDLQPAAFVVEADPFAVKKARRGETIQIPYSARRLNGFIGKMHTELAAPGCVTIVEGLRGRGETFVGQTDSGSLQIIVNDDAPLGPHRFLRLFTVGVVEDEPIYHGSSFLSLEVVE